MAYTAWSVVFGEQPTAAKWNQLGANDAGFKDGTNIDSLAILTRHLADLNVTTRKMLPTFQSAVAGAGASRQSIVGATTANLTGMSISYTSGATVERLFIQGEFICQAGSAGAQPIIRVNGSAIGRSGYIDTTSGYVKALPTAVYDIAANTSITITMALKNVGGTTTIANSNADQALAESYGQELRVLAFGR